MVTYVTELEQKEKTIREEFSLWKKKTETRSLQLEDKVSRLENMLKEEREKTEREKAIVNRQMETLMKEKSTLQKVGLESGTVIAELEKKLRECYDELSARDKDSRRIVVADPTDQWDDDDSIWNIPDDLGEPVNVPTLFSFQEEKKPNSSNSSNTSRPDLKMGEHLDGKRMLNKFLCDRKMPLPCYEVQMQGKPSECRVRARAIIGNLQAPWTDLFNVKSEAENEAAILGLSFIEAKIQEDTTRMLFPNNAQKATTVVQSSQPALPSPQVTQKPSPAKGVPMQMSLLTPDIADFKGKLIQMELTNGMEETVFTTAAEKGRMPNQQVWNSTATFNGKPYMGKAATKKGAEQSVAYQIMLDMGWV